jgi:hypothetical protein
MEKKQQAKISLTVIFITIKIRIIFLLLHKILTSLTYQIKVIMSATRQRNRALKYSNLISQKVINKTNTKELTITKTQR